MALNIDAEWHPPVALRKARNAPWIYECDEEDVPTNPGVYVFGRKHGDSIAPLYIGQTRNLRLRLRQHLDSVKLMNSIKGARNGSRFFLYCTVRAKQGQKLDGILKTLESALIVHALGDGHELFQKQGTKCPTHSISFKGNRISEAIVPRKMYVRIK